MFGVAVCALALNATVAPAAAIRVRRVMSWCVPLLDWVVTTSGLVADRRLDSLRRMIQQRRNAHVHATGRVFTSGYARARATPHRFRSGFTQLVVKLRHPEGDGGEHPTAQ